MSVHADGVELTDLGAVSQSDTAPGTALWATGDHCSGAAAGETVVVGTHASDVTAAGAGEASDAFHHITTIDTEVVCDIADRLSATDGALGRRDFALD